MYYFDDDVYKKQMDNLSRKLQTEGKEKQIFILFSNEPLQFEQSSNLLISSEKWFIDHHIMAQCDYLIGPPSTFTLWASFVGQSELIRIYNDTTV
jgi:tRNA A37 threonylcarbamoyladenosine dehydratase